MDSAYLQERITATKNTIAIYESAVDALAGNQIVSYKLDTGQTVQTVTKQDLASLQRTLDSLYNRLQIFQYRLNGGNAVIGRPGW